MRLRRRPFGTPSLRVTECTVILSVYFVIASVHSLLLIVRSVILSSYFVILSVYSVILSVSEESPPLSFRAFHSVILSRRRRISTFVIPRLPFCHSEPKAKNLHLCLKEETLHVVQGDRMYCPSER